MPDQPEYQDDATSVREGEQLNEQNIDAYLRAEIETLKGPIRIKQFPGGASNLTYLIQYDNTELVLRRPPFGKKAKSAHDMIREANFIEAIKPLYPLAPTVLCKSSDHNIMGCDFFVMGRIQGIIPRRELPSARSFKPADIRQFCLAGIDSLIALHEIPVTNTELQSLGKGTGYVKRQIEGWSERFKQAKTPDATSFESVMTWLHDNMPPDSKNCIIHNDFRFDNLVYDADQPTKVIGVLDWEMATLGDPLMDLGNSLAYWVEANDPQPLLDARLQPTHLDGMLKRNEVIAYYLHKTKQQVANFDFYEIYGIFRLAVIAQQIYFRFYHGQTKDKRFAGFGQFVTLLEKRCLSLLGRA